MSVRGQDVGMAAMVFSRKTMNGFLDSIPEDKWCHQATAGCNHPLWLVGHIAWTDDYFLQTLAGKESAIPESWAETFGMGSKPTDSMRDYPPVAEVREHFNAVRESLLAWYGGLNDEQLAQPLPEQLAGFAPNHAALGATMAWHEGMHTGQLTMARKSLGLEPIFG